MKNEAPDAVGIMSPTPPPGFSQESTADKLRYAPSGIPFVHTGQHPLHHTDHQ